MAMCPGAFNLYQDMVCPTVDGKAFNLVAEIRYVKRLAELYLFGNIQWGGPCGDNSYDELRRLCQGSCPRPCGVSREATVQRMRELHCVMDRACPQHPCTDDNHVMTFLCAANHSELRCVPCSSNPACPGFYGPCAERDFWDAICNVKQNPICSSLSQWIACQFSQENATRWRSLRCYLEQLGCNPCPPPPCPPCPPVCPPPFCPPTCPPPCPPMCAPCPPACPPPCSPCPPCPPSCPPFPPC